MQSKLLNGLKICSKMEKGQLLSTRILDTHGKIGPFFFKEFLFVFLGFSLLFFSILVIDLFIHVKRSLLLGIPGTFLLLISLLRWVFIKKIDSPWYIHKWVAYRFFKPKSIIADSLSLHQNKICFLIKKT
jgi:hypothetical protein